MDDDEFGIATFEDPAPRRETSAPPLLNVGKASRKAPKRRFRYRPDIDVEGKKYDGQRVSRADLELDTDYPIQDREPLDERAKPEDDEDTTASDLDAEHTVHDPESSTSATKRREAEERAITERLLASKNSDDKRSIAVRKQKSIYDSVVSMRIRLEPLMTVAKSFPSAEQRSTLDEWAITEEMTEAHQSTLNGLQSLVSHMEMAWNESWPDFSEDNSNKKFEKWRDAVLNQWGRKVEDAAGVIPKEGFKAFDTSVSTQVKAALRSGKQFERSRRVREPLSLMGGIELAPGSHEMQYDDSEFYRTLLREIIETGDAPGGGLRYAQLSKQGRVKKKKRAIAKGKRVKYDVHDKMVGFLAPVPLPDPGPIDEIVANLFGRQQDS